MESKIDSKRITFLILSALVVVGFFIRSYGIGRMDFWYDEIDLWLYSLTGETSAQEPPLMALLLYAIMWWFKSADSFLIHAIPVTIGSMTIPFSYFFAKKVAEERAPALVTAVLTTISPMAIYYSREGRPYALFILLSAALYLAFIHAHQNNKKSSWLIYSLLLFLCCLSHLLSAQIAATLGLFSITTLLIPQFSKKDLHFRINRFINFMLFSLAGGSLGTIWILKREGLFSVIHETYPFGLESYFQAFFVNIGPGPIRATRTYWGNFMLDPQGTFALILASLFFALFILGLYRFYRRGRNDFILLFSLAVLIPMVTNYLTLGEKGSWDWARYISHVMIPYLTVVSIGLISFGNHIREYFIREILITSILISTLVVALHLPVRPEYSYYQDMAYFLKKNVDRLSGVIVLPYRHSEGHADRRLANIYYCQKRETLPVFHLVNGELRKLNLVPSKGNITLIPQESPHQEEKMRSGNYAILFRRPLTAEEYEKMPNWLNSLDMHMNRCWPIMHGLTVCEISFIQL